MLTNSPQPKPKPITYADMLAFCLAWEGTGYEDVPGDPGGETFSGITHTDYDEWRRENKLPIRSVKFITNDEINAIYKAHYYLPIQGDKLPPVLAWSLFDAGVNVGTNRAIKWLQGVLGVKQDGTMGSISLAAVALYVDKHGAKPLALAVMDRRRAYYANLVDARPSLGKFLDGWNNRCLSLQKKIATSA